MVLGSRKGLALALALLGPGLLLGGGHAQETETSSTSVDPGFEDFWHRFREAVTLDDREAVRSMTRLPILLEGKEYDGDGFLGRFDWLFTSAEKECFASEAPARDGDAYQLLCGEMIFVFRNEGESYQFTDIGVND